MSNKVYYAFYLFLTLYYIKEISPLALKIKEISFSYIEPSKLILINVLI